MRYIWQHIQSITEAYDGTLPLAHFLKAYFRKHPKLGSRDRKILSEMSYCWYRCVKALPASLSLEEKVTLCLFLCETNTPHTSRFLPEEWQRTCSPEEKLQLLAHKQITVHPERLLLFEPALSEGITKEQWLRSMWLQPDLFIRVRQHKERLQSTLTAHHIPFRELNSQCLALPNGTAVDTLLDKTDYVIQDASSQQTGSYFQPQPQELWWDCCSGAGGKSLLLKDLQPKVKLTVSDKRASILHNLKERFRQYGHQVTQAIVTDVADAEAVEQAFGAQRFSHIICDVPCSGSGTWARTPEQLYYFKEEQIKEYSNRQKAIALNASRYLKTGGQLLYITCSVFRQENEEVVEYISTHSGFHVQSQQLINGVANKADSMFIAVLEHSA